MRVQNSCRTGRGLPFITRQRGTNTVIVRGGVPARSGATEVFVTVENPVHYFAAVTNETLQREGIRIMGKIVARAARPASRLAPGLEALHAAQHPGLRHQQEEPEPLRRAGPEDDRRGEAQAGIVGRRATPRSRSG